MVVLIYEVLFGLILGSLQVVENYSYLPYSLSPKW